MLEILQISDPVLRRPTKDLSTEEILSPSIQSLIQNMIEFTTSPAGGVGLAAPQIGKSLPIIVIEDRLEYQTRFCTPEQLIERERKPVPLHVLINPRLTVHEEKGMAEFFEACLSIPGVRGVVPRFLKVTVECLNEKAETVTIHARGWYARILQHEIDHLHGILFIDRAKKETLLS